MSLDILSVLSTKEGYTRFKPFVQDHTISKECQQIIKDMEKYYLSHEEIDWADFATWFKVVAHPTYKAEKLTTYDTIFTNMDSFATSKTTEQIVEKYITQDYCTRIADLALRGSEGNDVDVADIEELLSDYNVEVDRATRLEAFINTRSLSDIISTRATSGLTWRLSFLNRALGLLGKGKLICFSARPNAGKTTFLGNECVNFLPQLPKDQSIVWINNEEDEDSVKLRIVQCGLHILESELMADPVKYTAEFESTYGSLDRIKLIDANSFDTRTCEEIFSKHNPGVIIIDQLWKVRGYERRVANETQRLQMVFQWARSMAKQYAPVITVHQLGAEADGKKYPAMSDLYFSGTAIQGECDAIIAMGMSFEAGNEDKRWLNILKHKAAYGPEVDINAPHQKPEITLIPELAQFEE